jgi:Family of unknown function (DUF6152)
MKVRMAALFCLALGLLVVCVPAFAHHGNSAYDMAKTISLKATITKFEYTNPHTQVYFDAPDETGAIQHWVAETTNPAMLNRVGWSRDTLKAGDQVTLVANPNKVGARVLFLQKVIFSDGKELTTQKAF